MGRRSRNEREVRRLAARGRAAYGTRQIEGNLSVAGTVQPSGDEYLVTIDFYRAVGAFGDSVREESRRFPDADAALDHLADVTGIPVADLEIG